MILPTALTFACCAPRFRGHEAPPAGYAHRRAGAPLHASLVAAAAQSLVQHLSAPLPAR